ncbi:hypothetical protein MKW94_017161 [Papaver nudicaule]|uniref:Myb/SANT-like DNA-binding domain-containing protein n=1 Tax=Papaver nudicaule TaxID=74823 RepID=A0AA41SI20_PAPNU|nr:hypothetical protein [Papaver nudicaule]
MDRGEMNDTEEEARYPSNQTYNEQEGEEFEEDDYEEDVEEEDDEEEDEDEEENAVQQGVKEEVEEADEPEQQQLQQDHAGGDDDYEGEDDEGDTDDNEDEDDNVNGRNNEDEDSDRNGKKRKLKDLGYEFAPRVVAPQPSAAAVAVPKSSYGGRKNAAADWTEHATFILLDTWGDKFLQLGRKSLRLDEWIEVAKKVSQVSNVVRTDTQCRNRLDTLKKKYKKEKAKLEETGNNNSSCKWVYFKKMDMLMNVSPRQPGLTCGLDSREYVFANPRVYMNHSNGMGEMRDSPGNSESTEADDDDNSDGLPPKKARYEENGVERSSFRLLKDSIKKFGDIHAKIENSKRQQMLELEKMRIEFHRDIELHRRKILERAQAEIAKMMDEDEDDEEDDVSVENMSD